MVVKNIIRLVAEILDLRDVVGYIDGDVEISDSIDKDINNLMLAVNLVNNTIASSYLELVDRVKINVDGDKVAYKDIADKSIIEIKSVCTSQGKPLDYKVLPDGLQVAHYQGECVVEYTYFPDTVKFEDSIDYYLKVNETTFAIGVAGEFLYIKGDFNNAYMWDKRFKNAIFNLIRPKRNIVLPAKRW